MKASSRAQSTASERKSPSREPSIGPSVWPTPALGADYALGPPHRRPQERSFGCAGARAGGYLGTPALAVEASTVEIYRSERFSDHAAVTVAYDFKP